MQFCVHAIGDRANRVVLDIYEGVMAQNSKIKDWRWRIEHAQHIDTMDIPRFAKNKIIASMQGIHCTSDAPFVIKDWAENGQDLVLMHGDHYLMLVLSLPMEQMYPWKI